MRFQLTFDTKIEVWILSTVRGISQIWEATTAKRMKIDPYCQRRPFNVLFSGQWCILLRLYDRAFLR